MKVRRFTQEQIIKHSLLGGTGFFVLLISMPAILSLFHIETGRFFHLSFHGLCHQLPQRSFQLNGVFLPVCARCSGMYLGFFIAALAGSTPFLVISKHLQKSVLCLSLALLGADVAASFFGFIESPLWIKNLIGLFFGFSLLSLFNKMLFTSKSMELSYGAK